MPRGGARRRHPLGPGAKRRVAGPRAGGLLRVCLTGGAVPAASPRWLEAEPVCPWQTERCCAGMAAAREAVVWPRAGASAGRLPGPAGDLPAVGCAHGAARGSPPGCWSGGGGLCSAGSPQGRACGEALVAGPGQMAGCPGQLPVAKGPRRRQAGVARLRLAQLQQHPRKMLIKPCV